MREVVIVDGCRTPVGRRKGALTNYRADELFANVLNVNRCSCSQFANVLITG